MHNVRNECLWWNYINVYFDSTDCFSVYHCGQQQSQEIWICQRLMEESIAANATERPTHELK